MDIRKDVVKIQINQMISTRAVISDEEKSSFIIDI